MVEVRFREHGFVYVSVDIKPRHSHTMKSVSFKVDTGANRTTISREWLEKFGFDEEWIKTGRLLEGDECPTVASGYRINDCYIVILPEIHIVMFDNHQQSIHSVDSVQESRNPCENY